MNKKKHICQSTGGNSVISPNFELGVSPTVKQPDIVLCSFCYSEKVGNFRRCFYLWAIFWVSFCMYLPSSLAVFFRPSSSFFLKSVFLLDKEGSSLFKKTKRCLRASDATGPRGWTNRLRLSLANWQQAFGSKHLVGLL